MAQPLSRVHPSPSPKFGPDILSTRPKLAHYPMLVIEKWAYIDMQLSEVLTALLNTDIVVGVAMYLELGTNARRDALLAAARAALAHTDKDRFCLFSAVMKVVAPSRNRRNDFAHNIWGTCAELPDALLLIKPDVYATYRVQIDAYNRLAPTPTGPPRLDFSNIMVFREPDFQRDLQDARRAVQLVSLLEQALHSGTSFRDTARVALMKETDVTAAHSKCTEEP